MAFIPMSKVILKNLFSKPATNMYPIVKTESFERTRGKVENDLEVCVYCGLCQKKCPTGAIAVERTEKAWTIDPLRCITCSYCVESCPKKCLKMDTHYTPPMASNK
jgi:formate hydrogenlyase subunit 6/NADH:ubiquinone oxidoreductase subunit I